MAASDISRILFQPGKHYTGARLQQGRLLTDADFNEDALLGQEDRRRGLVDFIGPRAAPNDGFSLGLPLAAQFDGVPDPPQPGPLVRGTELLPQNYAVGEGAGERVRPIAIRAGTYYLGGMRFELEYPEPFMFQRDFLQMRSEDIPLGDRAPTERFRRLYYLHAWEQGVTAVEDRELLETALGGATTSVRLRRMRRVQAFGHPNLEASNCAEAFQALLQELEQDNSEFDCRSGELKSKGRLALTPVDEAEQGDCTECNPERAARFLGADNQTLRIMLTSPTTFVWALDNAASLYRVKVTHLGSDNEPIIVTLLNPPSSPSDYPQAGRVVEMLPFAALLEGASPVPNPDPHFNKIAAHIGEFGQVQGAYDPLNHSFVLNVSAAVRERIGQFIHEWDHRHPGIQQLYIQEPEQGPPPDERYFYLRVWHMAGAGSGTELSTTSSAALGATRIRPVFVQPGRRGDTWVAALRPQTPERVVPYGFAANPSGLPPNGPRRFYAPLAFLKGEANQVVELEDCRRRLQPLTERGCLAYTVGDGVTSFGDFDSIQSAVDALPQQGGRLFVLPGLHQGNIVISGRHNIAITGCGARSIVRSRPEPPVRGVFRVEGQSRGISLAALTLQSVDEEALWVEASEDIAASDIRGEVGYFLGGFVLNFAHNDFNLATVVGCQGIILAGWVLTPDWRSGIEVRDSQHVSIDRLSARGSRAALAHPRGPVVGVDNCSSVVVRGGKLDTFGQTGIVVSGGCSDVELRDVEIHCDQAKNISAAVQAAKPAIDIDGASNVVVRGNRMTMRGDARSDHPALVVLGTDIRIEQNHVEVSNNSGSIPGPAAWGGIHLRGGSVRVDVVSNHIVRGVGHGVTLGSLMWQPQGPATPRRLPAGYGIIEERQGEGYMVRGNLWPFTEDSLRYLPISEGPLDDIRLHNNHIEQMNSNGISVLTVLGIPPDEYDGFSETLDTARISITGNRVEHNAQLPYDNTLTAGQPVLTSPPRDDPEQELRIQVLPSGGIVLGTVSGGALIGGNVVLDNGSSPVVASNGIFVLNGERIVIENNRIVDNGAAAVPDRYPIRGVRAGIAVLLAGLGGGPDESLFQETLRTGGDDLPAGGFSARIANNTVNHPEGRALHVVATGPVSIHGNLLSSGGYHGSYYADDVYAIGDAVYVQNLGGPWERFDLDEILDAERVNLPNQPVPQNGAGRDTGEFLDYQTPRDAVFYLFNRLPHSPRFFVGLGGRVLFDNNQVILDWTVKRQPSRGLPLSFFPVVLLSLDHVGMEANQIALRLTGAGDTAPPDPNRKIEQPLLSHVFAGGATLNVTGNRIAGTIRSAYFSLIGVAELAASITHNQTTHFTVGEVVGVHAPGVTQQENTYHRYRTVTSNQVMFIKTELDLNWSERQFTIPRLFLQLLQRPSELGPPPTTLPGD